ncbi:MAG: DUF3797 domain-containing protein [Clostridiaceae bacterium]
MNARMLLTIMPKYNNCPNCGNDKVGDGEGKLIIEDNYFYRECKCGWSIKINEEGKEI